MPTVTIGFVPRERFSVAEESLEVLQAHTTMPFRLVYVDPGTPQPYRSQIRRALAAFSDVQEVRTEHFLLPSAAKNLVLEHASTDYICMLENDVLVESGWLSKLVAACEEFPADVVAPLVLEGRHKQPDHFDRRLGEIQESYADGETRINIRPLPDSVEHSPSLGRHEVAFVEQHCVLYKRGVFDRIGRFDEELNTREFVDVGLALHAASLRTVMEPRARGRYIPPPPVQHAERAYFRFRWDRDRAFESHGRIAERWRTNELPNAMEFVEKKLQLLSRRPLYSRLLSRARRAMGA